MTRERLLISVPFLLAALLLAVPALLSVRQPVDIVLTTSQVDFEVLDDTAAGLLGLLTSQDATFTGVDSFELAIGRVLWHQRPLAAESPISPLPYGGVTSASPNCQMTFGLVTLDQIVVSTGTKVTLAIARSGPPRLSATFRGGNTTVTFTAAGNSLTCNACGNDSQNQTPQELSIQAPRPQVLTVTARRHPFTVSLDTIESSLLMKNEVFVRGKLDFSALTPGVPRRQSTIIADGTITFSGSKSTPVSIHPGDMLHVEGAEQFRLHSITINNNGLRISLAGVPGDIKLGPDDQHLRRVEMSWLEWVHDQPSWLRYLEDVALIGSTLLAILTRLRIIKAEKPAQ